MSRTEANPSSATTADASMEEAEQPLFTSEIVAGLATGDADVDRVNLDVAECVDRDDASHFAREVEKITDLTLEHEGKENPTKKAERNAEPTSTEREVVNLTEDGGRTKRVSPVYEAARARAATAHIYPRRLAREEAAVKQSAEDKPREAPEMRVEGNVEGPARSAVEHPRRRRRVLINEEPEEEEEDVVFTLIDTLPSSGRNDPPAEVLESDRERGERKRNGKAIAAPVKKKPRQVPSTLVIQEGRQRSEEEDDKEEEALRRERDQKDKMTGQEERPSRGQVWPEFNLKR